MMLTLSFPFLREQFGMLIAFLLPAVQAAREAAQETTPLSITFEKSGNKEIVFELTD